MVQYIPVYLYYSKVEWDEDRNKDNSKRCYVQGKKIKKIKACSPGHWSIFNEKGFVKEKSSKESIYISPGGPGKAVLIRWRDGKISKEKNWNESKIAWEKI